MSSAYGTTFNGFTTLGNLDGTPINSKPEKPVYRETVRTGLEHSKKVNDERRHPKEEYIERRRPEREYNKRRYPEETYNEKTWHMWLPVLIFVAFLAILVLERGRIIGSVQNSTGQSRTVSVVGDETKEFPKADDETVEEISGSYDNSAADPARAEAERYMEEQYSNYEFVNMEQEGKETVFLYHVKDETEFLSLITPVRLICDTDKLGAGCSFDEEYLDIQNEWRLCGEWAYADETCNYNLKVNRCDGDTLYVEYAFRAISADGQAEAEEISSDGEVSVKLVECDDGEYCAYDPAESLNGAFSVWVYPYGGVSDMGTEGAGICVGGTWLDMTG